MKRFRLVASLALLFSVSAFCQDKPAVQCIADPEMGKSIIRQCSRSSPQKVKSFWTPSDSDIVALEQQYHKLYLLESFQGFGIDSMEKYGVQYLGVVIGRKKYIYINAFPKGSIDWYIKQKKDWTKLPMVVCDGGHNYWGALYDIESKKFSELSFNGSA